MFQQRHIVWHVFILENHKHEDKEKTTQTTLNKGLLATRIAKLGLCFILGKSDCTECKTIKIQETFRSQTLMDDLHN